MIIYHPKVIISPQKCALIPQNRSYNHIYLTFSLSKMIYALLLKNVASRIWMPGLGVGVGGWSTQFWQCQDFGNIWSPNPSLTMKNVIFIFIYNRSTPSAPIACSPLNRILSPCISCTQGWRIHHRLTLWQGLRSDLFRFSTLSLS